MIHRKVPYYYPDMLRKRVFQTIPAPLSDAMNPSADCCCCQSGVTACIRKFEGGGNFPCETVDRVTVPQTPFFPFSHRHIVRASLSSFHAMSEHFVIAPARLVSRSRNTRNLPVRPGGHRARAILKNSANPAPDPDPGPAKITGTGWNPFEKYALQDLRTSRLEPRCALAALAFFPQPFP